jgi:hypothetical protein
MDLMFAQNLLQLQAILREPGFPLVNIHLTLAFFSSSVCICFSRWPQVTTLVNSSNKGPSNKKKGRSKKAHVLAASVETATLNFLEKGEKIAKESQFLKEELTAAVEDVRKQGK